MDKPIFCLIQNKLMLEEKYSVLDSATATANILTCYDETVRNAIISWANGEDVTAVQVNGSSVSEVMVELSCSAFQALCFMNALTRDVDIYMDAVLQLEEDHIKTND